MSRDTSVCASLLEIHVQAVFSAVIATKFFRIQWVRPYSFGLVNCTGASALCTLLGATVSAKRNKIVAAVSFPSSLINLCTTILRRALLHLSASSGSIWEGIFGIQASSDAVASMVIATLVLTLLFYSHSPPKLIKIRSSLANLNGNDYHLVIQGRGKMFESSERSVSINEISTGAQLAIFSLRQWQIDRGDPDALETTLKPFYRRLNVDRALDAFLVLSLQFDRCGDDPLVANCPCQHRLHDNELRFLEWLMVDGASGSLEAALKDSSQARDLARQTAIRFSEALAHRGLAIELSPKADRSDASLVQVKLTANA